MNLGWEPQYLLYKASSSIGNWGSSDTARGLTTSGSTDYDLCPNSSGAETNVGSWLDLQSTGFKVTWTGNPSTTYIYLAIRRPNKPPKSGKEVYNAIARTGTGAAATVTGVGFAPDLLIGGARPGPFYGAFINKLRGPTNALQSNATSTEYTNQNAITSFGMDGATYGTDTSGWKLNENGTLAINWFFRRAPGFMDVVAYTGNGGASQNISHSLGQEPGMIIVKNTGGVSDWLCYHRSLGNTALTRLNKTDASSTGQTHWGSTTPTSSVFTVLNTDINNSDNTYVTYLFATLPGISKVGSYTGNGSSQTINCGFTTGARFVLVKRVDSTGDWYVWDTARGIVAANDPHLSLNTTAAEVTTDDSVDPDTSGFIINQDTATNINVSGGSYIFLAIA